jgi:hypothetical protein
MEALPASVQVGNLTLHIGRVMTQLPDSEAKLLHSALHGEMPKEPLAHSPDKDGLYSYVIGAKDYFGSAHLPRQFPGRMMVTCALDPALGLKSVLISDLGRGEVYCQAGFDSPAMATQTPPSEQAASSMAAQPLSRTNLSVFLNDDLSKELIGPHNPQDRDLQQHSSASVSTQSMDFSHDGSAGASIGVPGHSQTQPNQSTRSEPYPASSQAGSTSSAVKGSTSTRVQDPDNPGKTITLGALRKRQKVTDPETGQTVSKNALSKRQKVTDPKTGETVSKNALSKRQKVTDPKTGETVSKSALYSRQKVTDPKTGETVSKSALYGRQKRRAKAESA